MFTILNRQKQIQKRNTRIYLLKEINELQDIPLSTEEKEFIISAFEKDDKRNFVFNRLDFQIYIEIPELKENSYHFLETLRKRADKLTAQLQENKTKEVFVEGNNFSSTEILAFVEGIVLSNYSFVAFKTDKEKNIRYLEIVTMVSESLSEDEVAEMNTVLEATMVARNLVNQPVNYLNAHQLAEEIKTLGHDSGAKVEVFTKTKSKH
jgi:leucyl aminopeptidase